MDTGHGPGGVDMMTRAERIAARLDIEDFADVRAAYINRSRAETGRVVAARQWMIDNGWEQVHADGESVVTVDGRQIVRAFGVSWALRVDVLASRAQTALDIAAAQREERAAVEHHDGAVSEGIAVVTCPQMSGGKPCGGALNRSPVCPSCVTGKMGYKYRYTCESCGCDIVTREELR